MESDQLHVPAFIFSENGIRLSQEPVRRLQYFGCFYTVVAIWISHSVRTEIWTGSFRYLKVRCIYSWEMVSDPYGGHVLPPHEYWASAANSLFPLNSRRVRFLFLGRCHDRCIPQHNSKSCFSSSVWLMSSRQDDMSPSREPCGTELILQLTLNLHFYSW